MTWDVSTITEPVARKEYACDACELIHSFGIMESDVTPEEWAAWLQAKSDGYKILKGTKSQAAVNTQNIGATQAALGRYYGGGRGACVLK